MITFVLEDCIQPQNHEEMRTKLSFAGNSELSFAGLLSALDEAKEGKEHSQECKIPGTESRASTSGSHKEHYAGSVWETHV